MLQGRISRRLARTSGLTLLAALALAAAAPVAADAAFPGPGGRIAYIDNHDTIRAIEPDGSGDRVVYDYDGGGSSQDWGSYIPTGAAWSPDGRLIAFTGYEFCDGPTCGNDTESRVAIVAPDGGTPSTVTAQQNPIGNGAIESPSWSPDGKRIVYSGVDATGTRRLYVVPVAGGTPQALPLPAGASEPDAPVYSPDGTRIAFSAVDSAEVPRVYVMTVDGGASMKLTSGGTGQRSPSWSPDGTRIAYIGAIADGNAQLAVRPSSGGAADIVYSHQGDNGSAVSGRVSWSPSGDRIAFAAFWFGSGVACENDLRTIAVEGGGRGTQVRCFGAGAVQDLDWGVRPVPGDTSVVSASAAGKQRGGDGDTSDAFLTRGGRYAFFTTRASDILAPADATAGEDVYRRDLATGDAVAVSVDQDGHAVHGDSSHAVASPDGRWVAFRSTARDVIAGFEGGRSAVYVRDMEAGATMLASRHLGRPKLGSEGDAEPVAISDDGRYVLFASDATDVVAGQDEGDADRNLFRFDRQTGQTVLVDSTAAAAGAARMSADGRYVAFESPAGDLVAGFQDRNGAAPSIFRRDLTTGAVELVDGREGSATETSSGSAGAQVTLRGLSANGMTVLLASDDQDVVAGFHENDGAAPDLYLRQLDQPRAYLVSGFHGAQTEGSRGTRLGEAALSADGKVVAFATDGDIQGVGSQDNDAMDVFVRRFAPAPQPAELVTSGIMGATFPAAGASELAALSADGRHVLVRSGASDLTSPPTLHGHDALYRVDLPGHEVSAVTGGPDAEVDDASISGDGLVVAYRSGAGNLLDGWVDANADGRDAFAWIDHRLADQDVIPPDIAIATPAEGAIYRKDRNYEAQFTCRDVGGSGLESCDGTVPAGAPIDTDTLGDKTFTVTATDRAGNTTTRTVSYRVALANDHLSLVSGSGTASASGDSAAAAVSADARYVVFESTAGDVMPGVLAGGVRNIYRRDLRTGDTVLVSVGRPRDGDGKPRGGDAGSTAPRVSADGRYVAFASSASDLVAGTAGPALYVRDVQEGATRVVHAGETAEHAISRDGSTVVYTADGAVFAEAVRIAADGAHPQVSADGRRVLYLSRDHLYLDQAGTATLVDHAFGKADPADGAATGGILSADGATVLFGSRAANVAGAYHGEGEQLYRTAVGGDAELVTAAAADPAEGTGGSIAGARLSGDGTTATWQSHSAGVVADFADHNGPAGQDLYSRRLDAPARLVAHGETASDGVTTHPTLHAISDDGRFVLYGLWQLDADSEPGDARADLRRTDLLRDRVSAVASSPLTGLHGVSMSGDGRRIAFDTTSANMVDEFHDGNGAEAGDVYGWFDKPPVADATARITGPLALAFDGSGSSDSDGRILTYRWDFGDAQASDLVKPAHTYGDEDSFVVKLTIEDDGSNEVTYEFEVVAIKGVLTAGAEPLDFLGVDKHLRCSAVRDGAIFAAGGGRCGTFVALGGSVYGPPDLVDGVTPYTPVRQDASQDGDVAQLVTVVALGTSGVQVRQTDRYVTGAGWYRTDVALVNTGDAARDATVYRAANCVPGHALHDAGTAMAGCEGSTIAALLPLTPGAHHEAGAAATVLAHLAAGAQPDDTCGCDATDPAMEIGWPVSVPAHGEATRGSLGSFGPDGTIPLTVALKPDKDQVQPLDENAFTVTVRNANGVAREAGPIVADSTGVWDYAAGSTTGLTTADPASAAGKHTWAGPWAIPAHDKGELRFGVTHRNGTRIAITTATAAPAAGVTSAGIADLGEAKAAVDARPIEGSKPNTAIFDGPTGPTNDPEPRFLLVASKDSGVRYECRFAPAAWEDCADDYRPGPLPDATYALEVRAVDAFGTDETPAKRTFTVDTVAPNTVIASGPKKVTADNRPLFEIRAGEAGARIECRIDDGAWSACRSPHRTDALADGEHRFEARAVDAAGNPDPTPAAWTFRVDTTPPVTVIDGVSGRVLGARGGGATASGAGSGSTLALGGDGAAALAVSCPAAGPSCNGTVGLASEAPKAGIAKAGANVPAGSITLARAEFSAQPGQTVTVRLAVPMATRNLVERVGRMAVFTTLDLGTGRAVRGDDVVLTPDPRTARLLDAGRELRVSKGVVTLRLKCAKACSGTVRIGRHTGKFSGRTARVRVRVGNQRGTKSVRITTKPALTKRLTVTLRAKEARR